MRITVRWLLCFICAVAGGNWPQVIGAANQPPQVAILRPPYPLKGLTTSVTSGDVMLIKVAAQDPDGTVARVKLFANTNLIVEWTNPPYAVVWQPPFSEFPGECYPNWILTAVATDDSGNQTTSRSALVHGSCTAPSFPAAEILAPVNGAMFPAPATFQVSAELQVGLPDPAQMFDFWVGTNAIGSIRADMMRITPHLLGVTNLLEGEYQIRVTRNGSQTRDGIVAPLVEIRVVKLGVQLPTVTPDGHLQFDGVTAFPGRPTVTEVSSDLRDWMPISTNVPSGNSFHFVDLNSLSSSVRFYRLVVPP